MNTETNGNYAFHTPEYAFQIRVNPQNPRNVFLRAETPEAIEMAIDQIELAGTQEGEWAEDLLLETDGDDKQGYHFFVEISKPTLCLFTNFEFLNFMGV